MKIKSLNIISSNKIPKIKKQEIKTFTREYLKEQNGYVSSKNSFYNGVAIIMRGVGGALITGMVINELPKLIDDDIVLMAAQAVTGIGSLAVALSRLEADKIATGNAKVKIKPFINQMLENGYKTKEELLVGAKEFTNKTGGFFTSVIPNKFSTKKLSKLINEDCFGK